MSDRRDTNNVLINKSSKNFMELNDDQSFGRAINLIDAIRTNPENGGPTVNSIHSVLDRSSQDKIIGRI